MRVGEQFEVVVAKPLGFTDPASGAVRTLPTGRYSAGQPGSGDPGHGARPYVLQSLSDPGGQFLVPAATVEAWRRRGEIDLRAEGI